MRHSHARGMGNVRAGDRRPRGMNRDEGVGSIPRN
jgi:hypothetical protein